MPGSICVPVAFPESQFGEKALLLAGLFTRGDPVETLLGVALCYLQATVLQGNSGILPGLFKGFGNGQVHFSIAGIDYPQVFAVHRLADRGRRFGGRSSGSCNSLFGGSADVEKAGKLGDQPAFHPLILVLVQPVSIRVDPGLSCLADYQDRIVGGIAGFCENLVFVTVL